MVSSEIQWGGDVDQAIARASAEGRDVLLDFTATPF
jgi:hypothetical protein